MALRADAACDGPGVTSNMACVGVVLEILLIVFYYTNHSLIHAAIFRKLAILNDNDHGSPERPPP